MPNIRNMTYKGHNWIMTLQTAGTVTMSFRSIGLLTDKEYKQHKKDNPNPQNLKRMHYRRLKETDRELVEFKFGKEDVPEV